MSETTKKNKLAEPSTALNGLLENLLSEVGIEQDIIPQKKTKKTLKKTAKRSITEVVEAEKASAEVVDIKKAIPKWGEEEFTALIFEAKGTKFAVPLVLLNGITPLPEKSTIIPGQPEWHLGVSMLRGKQLVAVDVHKLFGFSEAKNKIEISKNGYLIVVGDGGYGLYSEGLGTPIKLLPKDVRWATSSGDKEWLAGMLPDHMCALLDIEGVISSMYTRNINN